ncbi:MAG TPA: phosphatase PAP2 family protein, partial [Planococcus sp. (in: firmicutes)]|nr:phosphatase PAP2 family protein [Planococcus sp. (in: firmicutes)]
KQGMINCKDLERMVVIIRKVFYPLAVATLLGFFAILYGYSTGALIRIDTDVSEALGGMRWLDNLSVLGDQWVIVLAGLAMMVYLWVHRKNYRGMFFVFLTIGAGNALNRILKETFERERPNFPYGLESFSFPSNHAMLSLLTLFTIAYFLTDHIAEKRVKALVWSAATVLTVAIGLSRVAGLDHYFSDVLAGWFIGYTWFVAIAVWYELRERSFKRLRVIEDE